jgi:hypothetical protein
MGLVRPFRDIDLPRIIELNSRLFPGSSQLSPEEQEERFRQVCFENPCSDSGIPSLVYEESNGVITGFLGVTTIPMLLGSRPIRGAVGQHLMVEHSPLASLHLFKTFFSGPQDFSFTDRSVDVAKSIWERMGGMVSYAHSTWWRRPLMPARMISEYLGHHRHSSGAARLLRTTVPAADALAAIIPGLRPVSHDDSLKSEPLSPAQFLRCVCTASASRTLRPVWSPQRAAWIFDRLKRERRFGHFHPVHLVNRSGETVGWYCANMKTGGTCEVLQVWGKPKEFPMVLNYLLREAKEAGCIEVIGRLDPVMTAEYRDRFIFFAPGRNWMLLHSNNTEILHAIESGNVYLTRMEGDLWLF